MTWPGGSTQDPADLRLEPGRVEEKIREEKPSVTWLTRQDPVKNPIATC